jgi:hypothetical protein
VYVVGRGGAVATGAVRLDSPDGGWGAACQRALAHLSALARPPDTVAFLDAAGAESPAELGRLVDPIRAGVADLVIGSRKRPRFGDRLGSALATSLIRVLYGRRYHDLGSFRAARLPALVALGMRERGDAWNVEMLVKAVRAQLRVVEVSVTYRREQAARPRLADAIETSYQVLYTILRHSTSR